MKKGAYIQFLFWFHEYGMKSGWKIKRRRCWYFFEKKPNCERYSLPNICTKSRPHPLYVVKLREEALKGLKFGINKRQLSLIRWDNMGQIQFSVQRNTKRKKPSEWKQWARGRHKHTSSFSGTSRLRDKPLRRILPLLFSTILLSSKLRKQQAPRRPDYCAEEKQVVSP